MSSAVDSGRQRQLLQQAQALATELRSMPLDPATVRGSLPRMFDLVRLVKRFIEATSSMPADETRAMWEQRGQWLQEEVAALAQERLHSTDQQQYWLNLVLLLFSAADACDRVLREKVEMESQLHAAAQEVAAQRARVQQLEQQLHEAAASTRVPTQVAEEVLTLRSKAVVLAQQLEKKDAEQAEVDKQLQLVMGERDSLRQQVDALRAENQQLQETADARVEVIQRMMAKSEESSKSSEALFSENAKLQGHCRTLGVNLETNAKVIEKLIELNSELMDVMNTTAAKQQQKAKEGAAGGPVPWPPYAMANGQGSEGLAARLSAGGTGGLPPGPSSAGGVAVPPPQQGSSAGSRSGPAQGAAGLLAGAGLPQADGGGVDGTSAARNGNGPAGGVQVAPARAVGPPPGSFEAAFEAFLKEPDPPPKATADVLALPSSADPHPRRGISGRVLGGAAGVLKYVWGTAPQQQPQSQQQQQQQAASAAVPSLTSLPPR